MAKRVIVDFDNTMGVPGCDVDDGLALLYLLGCDDVQVEAICTTYGNSTLPIVHENTERIMKVFGLDVPLLRGVDSPLPQGANAPGGQCANASIGQAAASGMSVEDAGRAVASIEQCEAPRYLADALAENPGELHVLATGSTTNLGAADMLRPGVLADAASVTLMGGITQSLAINGRIMDELNLSCDPQATLRLLSTVSPVSIATAQNCLPAFFTRDDLVGTFGEDSWLCRTCEDWFRTMKDAYSWDGWTCWDVVAAVYMMRPDLFCGRIENVSLYERMLGIGYLERGVPEAPHAAINLPEIRDVAAFKKHVLETWQHAAQKLGLD